MNNFDLQLEMERNNSDKELAKTELEVSRNKWVKYIMDNKENICSFHQPIVVKKKFNVKIKEFIDKIKTIFGLMPRKENNDGIEAYLRYRDDFE